MLALLLAAGGTFLLWTLSVAALVAALSALLGWQVRRLVPRRQHVIPRHLIVAVAVLKGSALGSVAGLHVGGAAATLAVGDALAGKAHIIWRPWKGAGSARGEDGMLTPVYETARAFQLALRGEWQEIRVAGPVKWIGGEVLLGALHAPLEAVRVVGEAYLHRSAMREVGAAGAAGGIPEAPSSAGALTEAWQDARPRLAAAAMRTIAMTAILTTLHLGGLTLLGLGLIGLARHELRAAAAVRPAAKASRRLRAAHTASRDGPHSATLVRDRCPARNAEDCTCRTRWLA